MRRIVKLSIVAMVACLVLTSALPCVKADGMPLTTIELHGTLRENRQLAYISVNETGESERLDLFLSVVSLEPGNSISIMIPLRTAPTIVNGQEMSESQFRRDRNYDIILEEAERQNNGFQKLGQDFEESMGQMSLMQGVGMLYLMVISFGTGGDDGGYYELADGVSMEVMSFNSTDSLSEFYASQGVPVPEQVEEIIEEYGDFNIGIINAITSPPIDQEKFDRIAEECPGQLAEFRVFVENNPTIETYEYLFPYVTDDPELENILRSISDNELRYDFAELMMATYGIGQLDGTLISFELPLYGGQAFFPLGTTPAWQGVHKTEVIFEVQDSSTIDFNHDGDECFIGGNHYYTWAFEYEAPDYDLEGEVETAGIGTDLNRLGRAFNSWIYDNSNALAYSMSILILGTIWTAFFWFISRARKWDCSGKWHFGELAFLGFSCMAAASIGTFAMGAMVALAGVTSLERRYLPPSAPRVKEMRVLGIEIMFGFIVSFTGLMYLWIGLEEDTAYFLGFAGSIWVMAYYVVFRKWKRDEWHSMGLPVWGIYIASLLPAIIVPVVVEFCIIGFMGIALIQTTLFMFLMREFTPDNVEQIFIS